jgi:hypothetical protein
MQTYIKLVMTKQIVEYYDLVASESDYFKNLVALLIGHILFKRHETQNGICLLLLQVYWYIVILTTMLI